MNTTRLTSIIKFWENKGHFDLDLYHKYLISSSEHTPEKFNETETEGDLLNVNTAYIIIFILAAIILVSIKYLF